METYKILILGTEYEFVYGRCEEMEQDEDGCTDFINKTIHVDKESILRKGGNYTDTLNEVVAHELCHAFMYESGIDYGTSFHTEEVVNWFGRMFQKIDDLIGYTL